MVAYAAEVGVRHDTNFEVITQLQSDKETLINGGHKLNKAVGKMENEAILRKAEVESQARRIDSLVSQMEEMMSYEDAVQQYKSSADYTMVCDDALQQYKTSLEYSRAITDFHEPMYAATYNSFLNKAMAINPEWDSSAYRLHNEVIIDLKKKKAAKRGSLLADCSSDEAWSGASGRWALSMR